MFFLALSAQAQVQVNGELKNLINQSFTYFPKIKEVQGAVSTAQQRVELTKTNLPSVAADGSYSYVRPKIEIPFPIGPGGALENFQFAPVDRTAVCRTQRGIRAEPARLPGGQHLL